MNKIRNSIDRNFYGLVRIINSSSEEQLEDMMKQNLEALSGHELYKYLIMSYNASENERFWGKLDPAIGEYSLIKNRVSNLKNHIEDFKWLYENLEDYRSKDDLYAILANWITFNWEYLFEIREKRFKDYFDLDLIPEISEEEVFVDLGGYIGDTIADFVETYGEIYSHIISYEVDPVNYDKLVENTKNFIGIDARKKGAGDGKGTMFITSSGSTTKTGDIGQIPVEIVSLDEDIQEKVTWIKMDIEGAEQSAINGLKGHIVQDNPKLTICTYHSNEDIWKIPRMIKDLNNNYKLYMRYYGGENSLYPCEYVLYAL